MDYDRWKETDPEADLESCADCGAATREGKHVISDDAGVATVCDRCFQNYNPDLP